MLSGKAVSPKTNKAKGLIYTLKMQTALRSACSWVHGTGKFPLFSEVFARVPNYSGVNSGILLLFHEVPL